MKNITKAPIIFDFDGTLVDSFDTFIESLEEVLDRKNNLTKAEINELRGLNTKQVLSRLHIRFWQIPKLLTNGRKSMASKIKEVELFSDIDKGIENMANNHPLYILSTNDNSSIAYVLKKYGLLKYFIDIQGNAGLLSKKKNLLKLAKKHRLNITDCIYVGDEIRDIEAASSINMKSIAVAWGYSTKAALASANPTLLIDKPSKLAGAVDSIS
jgi:phosphoglycolate phosphatase